MNRKSFTPAEGEIYENEGGGAFRCLYRNSKYEAVMRNIGSGWTFTAHGIGIYDDGKIDWDYSTGGHFTGMEGRR